MKRVTLILANQTVITKYFLLAILFHFLIIDNAKAQQMVHTGTVTRVFEKRINLIAGTRVSFEAKNLSPGSDPVINLLLPQGRGVIAANRGGPGVAEHLNYLPILTGSFILIVTSRTRERSGTADIYVDGALLNSHVSFGGWLVPLQNLRSGEILQTVKLPGGSNGNHKIYILKEDQFSIQTRASSFDSGLALVRLTNELGNRTAVVGTDFDEGLVRFVRNDAAISGHDVDKDSLGIELEREIGTCSSNTGVVVGCNCSTIADPRDTDGDGIPDGWEVLGRYDMRPFQLLPKWGANPRHKDLFIEVDFMRRTWNENSRHHIDNMLPNVARHFAGIYGDVFTTDPRKRSAHAEVLRNPDGAPGVSVHLDIGIEPQTQSDMTIFGNWGGFNSVDAVQPNGTPCNSRDVACKGIAANVAWKNEMEVARRGIFRYTLGYSSGGGSNGNTFACDFNFHDLTNPPHEFGHTLGMGHSGPYGITDDVDPNCKPNYPSIMNYAFLNDPNIGFSDGAGLSPLNNERLTEWNAVPASNTKYLDILENKFLYWVDRVNGHVDWNRNGIFEPAGQTVRAYANNTVFGGGCEYTRYNYSQIPNTETTTTPALARLSDRVINNRERLYLFYTSNGRVKYRYSTSSWDCPVPEKEGCANGSWSTETEVPEMNQSVGVAVMNDLNSLRLISVQFNGKIIEKTLSLVGGIQSWTTAKLLPGSAAGEPSLSFGLKCSFLVYKGTDQFIHFNKMHQGEWGRDEIALSAPNTPVKSTFEWAFPNIIQAVLPYKPNAKCLYGFFPAEDAKLDVWRYNDTTNLWEKTKLLDEPRPGPIHSKSAVAFVPYNNFQEDYGRLYLAYTYPSTEGGVFAGQTKMRISYVKMSPDANGNLIKTEKIGLESSFNNYWFGTYGLNLFYERGKDKNLRAAFTIAKQQFRIQFWPKADAINDFAYINYNDWETIRKNLCRQVVNPGGTVPSPISCAED